MKPDAKPIPLASVVVFPRGLARFAVGIGTLGVVMAAVTVILVAAGWVEPPQGERLAAMLVALAASLFAFALAWVLPRARIRARDLFVHVRRVPPRSLARVLLALVAVGVAAVAAAGALWGWGSRQMGMTVVDSLIVIGIVGGIGLLRRHLHRQAVAVFAVYAEGALDPADARAIDAARAADPVFDAAVRDYLRINAMVAEQVRSPS